MKSASLKSSGKVVRRPRQAAAVQGPATSSNVFSSVPPVGTPAAATSRASVTEALSVSEIIDGSNQIAAEEAPVALTDRKLLQPSRIHRRGGYVNKNSALSADVKHIISILEESRYGSLTQSTARILLNACLKKAEKLEKFMHKKKIILVRAYRRKNSTIVSGYKRSASCRSEAVAVTK